MHQPHPDVIAPTYGYNRAIDPSYRFAATWRCPGTDWIRPAHFVLWPRECIEALEEQRARMSRRARHPWVSVEDADRLHQPVDSVLWYVTLIPRGTRRVPPKATAFLLGPYDSHAEAAGNVSRGKRLAEDYHSQRVWDMAGVSALPDDVAPRVHFADQTFCGPSTLFEKTLQEAGYP